MAVVWGQCFENFGRNFEKRSGVGYDHDLLMRYLGFFFGLNEIPILLKKYNSKISCFLFFENLTEELFP